MLFIALACLFVPAFAGVSRIVGGSDASSAGSALSLRAGGNFVCGAVLVGRSKAVTAAHCVDGRSAASLSVGAGSVDRTSDADVVGVSAVSINPSYSNSAAAGYPGDFAVLTLSAAPGTGSVGMAAGSNNQFDGSSGTGNGWGATSSGGAPSTTLQQFSSNVISAASCQSYWSQVNADDHLCVYNGATSACNGDSGSGFVSGGVLAGTASWGSASCSPSMPSVYANVASFSGWASGQ